MYICGSKEKFRMYRDGHSLDAHFRVVKRVCNIVSSKVIWYIVTIILNINIL